MDYNALVQAITTVGFPIVCCGALFWNTIKQQEMHKEESDKMTEALNNNTLVLQKLIDKLDKE